MNSQLKKLQNTISKKDFLKMINNAVFGKTIENVRKKKISSLQQLKQQGII